MPRVSLVTSHIQRISQFSSSGIARRFHTEVPEGTKISPLANMLRTIDASWNVRNHQAASVITSTMLSKIGKKEKQPFLMVVEYASLLSPRDEKENAEAERFLKVTALLEEQGFMKFAVSTMNSDSLTEADRKKFQAKTIALTEEWIKEREVSPEFFPTIVYPQIYPHKKPDIDVITVGASMSELLAKSVPGLFAGRYIPLREENFHRHHMKEAGPLMSNWGRATQILVASINASLVTPEARIGMKSSAIEDIRNQLSHIMESAVTSQVIR